MNIEFSRLEDRVTSAESLTIEDFIEVERINKDLEITAKSALEIRRT